MQWLARVRHQFGQLGFPACLALLIFVLAMQPASAQASTLTILSPASGDEIRGDGADLKNVVRFSTLQPSDFGYYVDISEVDQDAPTHPAIGLPVSITVLATAVIPEGNHTFSFPFDFNRPELAGMGSGLFRMTLRSVTAATVTTSAPVLYFKGRPAPSLVMNADDPFLLKCSATAGDPDASPDYEYTFHFVRTRDREEVAALRHRTSSESLTQADLELPALEGWEDYDVTLSVTDSLNRTGTAGQGLTGQTTIHVHANAGPIVSLSGLSDGAVFQAQRLPYVVTFGAMAIDDVPGSITLQADVDGNGIPEAEATVSNYASASLSVPVLTSRVVEMRVRGIDDKGQAGPFATKRIRVNTPPNISIDPKLMQFKGGSYLPVQLVATDSFSDRIKVELSLDGSGQATISQDVDSNITTTLFVPVSDASVTHMLLVRAIDGDGIPSAYIKRTIEPKASPTLTILSPTHDLYFVPNSTVSASNPWNVQLVLMAHDDYISPLDLYFDGNGDGFAESVYQIASDTPTTISVNITSMGAHTISAWAFDAPGVNGLQSSIVKLNLVLNDIPFVRQLTQISLVNLQSDLPPYRIGWSFQSKQDFNDEYGMPNTIHVDFLDGTIGETIAGLQLDHAYQSMGMHRLSYKVSDVYGESSAEVFRDFRLNDTPRPSLQGHSAVYDSIHLKYVVQKDQETSFSLRAFNMERDANPLRLKVQFEPTVPAEYTLDDPPVDKSVAHVKDIIVRHTFRTAGDFQMRFEVGEKIQNQSSTGTLVLFINVVDPNPPPSPTPTPHINSAGNWNGYK